MGVIHEPTGHHPMVVAPTTMNNKGEEAKEEEEDAHEHDVVMPGFRFHPTEEELIEFYLRRKVEGKRFNVELITFLDLYRYDPWELPTMALIGEKEWFFYVPRDRKYRNGDRPNRVTTSGYWKATGADRMIRGENSRPIGLKKTLVFYSGKAPKGVRSSWIMNEYRLPHHVTQLLQKAEISLCRVYKRAGVEGHPQLHSRPSSSTPPSKLHKKHTTTTTDVSRSITTNRGPIEEPLAPQTLIIHPPQQVQPTLLCSASKNVPEGTNSAPPFCSSMPTANIDELNRLLDYHQQDSNLQFLQPHPQPQLLPPFPTFPDPAIGSNFQEKFWEWSVGREFK